MTLYHVKGLKNSNMKQFKSDFSDLSVLTTITNFTYTRKQPISFKDKASKHEYKLHEATYFISGTIIPQTDGTIKRNNQSVTSRTLLPLDFDDLPITANRLISTLKRQQYKVLAYPTISHGLDKNINHCRYRVIFELDRPVNAYEYKTLIINITEYITRHWFNINHYKRDNSNTTMSQLMGMYTKTIYNENAPIYYNLDKKALSVDTLLQHYGHNKAIKQTTSRDDKEPCYKAVIYSDNDIIHRIQQSKQGDKFNQLYQGNIADYPSQSEARLSLINMLIFWTGGNIQQIENIMRGSQLNKDKWDTLRNINGQQVSFITYEITKALESYRGNFYHH